MDRRQIIIITVVAAAATLAVVLGIMIPRLLSDGGTGG